MAYEVQTPGKKLKKIRKQIGARQQDIAGDNFKRELISLIENDKVNLIKSTAEILIDTINIFISKNYIDREQVTIEDLLEDPSKQIEKIADIYILELQHIKMGDDLEKNTKNKLEEIENFINRYNISSEKKCDIYDITASIYFKCSSWEESKLYYFLCRDLALITENYQNVLKYLGWLTRVYYKSNNFSEIITISKFAEQIISKFSFDEKSNIKTIYFNTSLAYSKTGQYTKAIDMLNKLISIPGLNRNEILDLNMQKGNCYLKEKEYVDAEIIFKNIVEMAIEDGNSNAAALAYLNLATVKIETNEYYQAEKLTDLASQIKTNDIFNETFNMYNATLVYIKINKPMLVDKYFLEAVEHSITIQNQEMQRDLINNLTDYFIEHSYYKMLERLLILVKRRVLSGEIKIREIPEIFMLSAEAVNLQDKKKKYYDEAITLINYFRKST